MHALIIKVILFLFVFTLMSEGSVYSNEKETEMMRSSVSINPGKLIFINKLTYKILYDEKPFPNATIYYYDNGVYRITSEGEDHYGVYVKSGDFTHETVTIRFISLPSPDWRNKTAYHNLTFYNNKEGPAVFTQQAINESGDVLDKQYGVFISVPLSCENKLIRDITEKC